MDDRAVHTKGRRLRVATAGLGALLVAAAIVFGAVPATADYTATGGSKILAVDTTVLKRGAATVETTGLDADQGDVSVKEAGADVSGLSVEQTVVADERNIVALVLDTSAVTKNDNLLDEIKAGAIEVVNALPDDARFIVAGFGNQEELVIGTPTSDKEAVVASINGLEAGSTSYQSAALRNVVGVLQAEGATAGQVLLVSTGTTDASDPTGTQRDEAIRGFLRFGTRVQAVGLKGSSDYADARGGKIVKYYADKTGGTFQELDDPEQVKSTLADFGTLLRREAFSATWDSDLNVFPIDQDGQPVGDLSDQSPYLLSIGVDDVNANAVVNPGTFVFLPTDTDTIPKRPSTLGLSSPTVRILSLTFGGVAVALMILAAALLAQRENVDVLNRVNSMEEWAAAQSAGEDTKSGSSGIRSFADSGILKAAVQRTTEIARQRGVLSGVESKLEQAAISFRAGEAIFFVFVASIVAMFVGFIFFGVVPGIVLAGLAVVLPQAMLNRKASKRLAAFNAGLPDMLNLLSSSLRAGYSAMQALDAVASECSDPMGSELQRVVLETQLGRPANDALMDVAFRMKSPDFEWAVMAINIQREVGGNLSELLDTVASTMLERERLRREIKALTAEGRASAYLLGFMPGALLAVMYMLNKEYISTLFNTGLGQVLLGLGIFAQVVGMLWMRKIVSIKL
jgi:tight adherence protein B